MELPSAATGPECGTPAEPAAVPQPQKQLKKAYTVTESKLAAFKVDFPWLEESGRDEHDRYLGRCTTCRTYMQQMSKPLFPSGFTSDLVSSNSSANRPRLHSSSHGIAHPNTAVLCATNVEACLSEYALSLLQGAVINDKSNMMGHEQSDIHREACGTKTDAVAAVQCFTHARTVSVQQAAPLTETMLITTAWMMACNEPLIRFGQLLLLFKGLGFIADDAPKYNHPRFVQAVVIWVVPD